MRRSSHPAQRSAAEGFRRQAKTNSCHDCTDEERKGLSVFNYKLVGIIESEENMFASLIDQDGEVLTLSLFEELTPGVRLIALDTNEIVFEREEDSLVVINFKNQIIERDK